MPPRVLKPSGVLFLQCDAEANSYLRLLLDAVFGRWMIGRFPAVQLLWIDDKGNSRAKVQVTEGIRSISQITRNLLAEDKETDATWASGFELPFPRAR